MSGQFIPAWRYSRGIYRPRQKPASLFTIHFSAITNYTVLMRYFRDNPDNRYADSTWIVGQDGQWDCMVKPDETPWTNGTGMGTWPDENGVLSSLINDMAFTVETSNDVKDGYFQYTEQQYNTLAYLFRWTLSQYTHTHVTRINGHEHMVPNHKVDPGPAFDWEKFLVEHVGIKKQIYKEYLSYLQKAADIKQDNWWNGITQEQFIQKKNLCIESALKIAKDINKPSTYYMEK